MPTYQILVVERHYVGDYSYCTTVETYQVVGTTHLDSTLEALEQQYGNVDNIEIKVSRTDRRYGV